MTRPLFALLIATFLFAFPGVPARAAEDDNTSFVADNLKYSREFYSYVHLVAIAKSPVSFAYDRYPSNGPERIRCDLGTFARLHGKTWLKSDDWAESGSPPRADTLKQLDTWVGWVETALNFAPEKVKLANKSEADGRTQWLFDVSAAGPKAASARLRFAKPLFDGDDDVLLHGFVGAIASKNEKTPKGVEFSFGYLVNEGDYEISERAWEDLQGKEGGGGANPRPNDGAGYVARAKVRWKRGDVAGAIIDFNRAIDRDTKTASTYYERGVARRMNQDTDGALNDLNRAIELDPKNGDAYNERGIARRAKHDFDGAIADYTKSIELEPKKAEYAYFNRALSHEAKKDVAGALADYAKVVELNPKNANAFKNRGDLKLANKDADGAIADYNKAIELNPKLAVAYQHTAPKPKKEKVTR